MSSTTTQSWSFLPWICEKWNTNGSRIEEGAKHILDLLNGTGTKNVVMDFHKTDYFGSTALAFFVKLWMKVRRRRSGTTANDGERG